MAIYSGYNDERDENGRLLVTKDGETFSPAKSQKFWNHGSEFNWGYGGSGPAQLALAILLEETDEATAMRLHQRFKWQVIAALNQNEGWELTSDRIQKWIEVAKVTKGNFL